VSDNNDGDEVDYVDIEAFLPSGKEVDLLKCDIEGSEELFVKEYSGLLCRTKLAVFEFHGNDCDVDNCRNMLLSMGLESVLVLRQNAVYNTSVEVFKRPGG
jgi:hypothetical protein